MSNSADWQRREESRGFLSIPRRHGGKGSCGERGGEGAEGKGNGLRVTGKGMQKSGGGVLQRGGGGDQH